MKLGEMIARIQFLEKKDDLLQRVIEGLGQTGDRSELIVEVQTDIDRILRAPVIEELEKLKNKEVQDGSARNPPRRKK